jgi:hypothetical protein
VKRAREILRLLIRDIASPLMGLFLAYQQGSGHIPYEFAWLFLPFSAALIGIPVWTRQDERERGDDDDDGAGPPTKGKSKGGFTFTIGRGGDDE